MIITELRGGLGNQMFCYAAGYAVAKRSNVSLRIDSLRFIKYTNRVPPLYCFPISAQEASPDERSRVANEGMDLSENGHSFDPRLMCKWTDAYLRGFWQSENYFSEFRRDILLTQYIPTGWNKNPVHVNLISKMRESTSVAVHIRRGDYVTNPISNEFHGVLPESYYQAANARMLCEISQTMDPKEKSNIVYFIFSDDIEWASRNLHFFNPRILVSHNTAEHGHCDMYLMSQANHHIIANSSFSWWGAWLCSRPDQIVVAPAKWFQNRDADSQEIVPLRWIRV
jgi:Glycosyl transferase family 11